MIILNDKEFINKTTAMEWIRSSEFRNWISEEVFPLRVVIPCEDGGPVKATLEDRKPWCIDQDALDVGSWNITYTTPWQSERDPSSEQEAAFVVIEEIIFNINAVLNT